MAASGTVFTSGPHLAAVIAPGPAPERGFPYNLHVMAKEQRIAYGAGKAVVVRSLANPADCFVYKGHNQPVTCAKFAPNGFWVASGDASGHVRVWAWDHPEHLPRARSSRSWRARSRTSTGTPTRSASSRSATARTSR